MRKGELIVAAIFFIIACVVVGEAFRLGFRWGLSGPQAGFVPLGEALLLMISSVVIFISGLKDKSGKTFFIDKRGMTEAVKIFCCQQNFYITPFCIFIKSGKSF